jgi:SAM-dependent methyltransferase
LTCAPELSADTFDCIICTQTLQFIYEVRAAIGTLHRILKPGGVLLVTVPGISQISRYDMDHWGDYWRFTTQLSAACSLPIAFSHANVTVQAYGNVLSAISLLHGLASEELDQKALDSVDPDYEVLIAIRAVKPEAPRENPWPEEPQAVCALAEEPPHGRHAHFGVSPYR